MGIVPMDGLREALTTLQGTVGYEMSVHNTTHMNYWLSEWIERKALAEVQSHVATLSRAIQISVQQLPQSSGNVQAILRDYQTRLQSSGVEEMAIICRDCFVHLHIEDIKRAIRNFKRSGSTYVLMTTFTKIRYSTNTEIGQMGHWRTLNLQLPPFNLPEPILLLNEGCTEANPGDTFDDKCLGLWRLADINI